MTDIALAPGADGTTADLLVRNGDLATDDGLQTAVILSLLCDRLADADDQLPTGSTDRRGWWGDAYLPPLPDGSPDFWGSKLWLRRRQLATVHTQRLIEDDCTQALQWMVADNVAASVVVTSRYLTNTELAVNIAINQRIAGGATALRSFDAVWNTTLGSLLF